MSAGKIEGKVIDGIEFKTAPYDPRFPNQNQTRYCYQMFLDFYRCTKLRGDNYEPCKYFKFNYEQICPDEWIEEWQDQMGRGVFPVKI